MADTYREVRQQVLRRDNQMGDRSGNNRQELQSALEAVTTSFEVGRPVSPSGDGSSPAPVVPVDGKQELASAYEKLVEHEASKPTTYVPPPPAKWKRFLKPVIIAVSVTAAVYLTVARPAWLYPTFDAPVDPKTEGSAEQVLVASSLLVAQFQREYGRLPDKLSDIAGSFPSVSMMVTGAGSYRLLSAVGGHSLVMTIAPGQEATLEGGSR